MLDISSLNEAQKEAVLTTEGPVLVLAGAGSGKTRVLTYRIAHLVQDLDVAPWRILAVTFTNKAANEMRERLGGLLAESIRGMWICTFHSMCVRILRSHADLLGFTQDFTIYDADNSKRLVKDIMAELGLGANKRISDNALRSRISKAKNELIGPKDYKPKLADPLDAACAKVYKSYQQRLLRANALDFDDLLYYTYLLLRDNPEVREEYGQRFRYILVDEYQDTNRAQYEICKMLAQVHGNLMVVGDDDQSIYSWRGADIRNILDFERDWPAAKTVKLEENYRSTGTILAAANAVVAHNESRKPKKLFTRAPEGEKIACYMATDERDEGRWIAAEIEHLHDDGCAYNSIAVFYRTNAQSRVLEDMLLRAGVPYVIIGNTNFYDRAEIRDVCAYLKLVVNPSDDMSCMRIINTPRRGIGKTTIERIALTAHQREVPFLQAAREEALDPACRAATKRALDEFVGLIDEAQGYSGELDQVVNLIVEKTGLVASLEAQHTPEAQSRVENIHEFMGVVHEYVASYEKSAQAGIDAFGTFDEDAGDDSGQPAEYRLPTLASFMEWVSLRSDLDTLGDGTSDMVTLMTVHSAKGLEFDTVFVAGLEENIFPHLNSVLEQGVEEERRLAYVAITRARKRLVLTYAQTRRLYNKVQANRRSRFIDEMPPELLKAEGVGSLGLTGTGWEKRGDRRGISGSGRGEEMYGGRVYGKGSERSAGEAAGDAHQEAAAHDASFAPGDMVDHKVFGKGTVTEVQGDVLVVCFAKNGKTKKLLKGLAPLVKIARSGS